jgi:hypothetical protein
MTNLDQKIKELILLNGKFVYPEYYTHTNSFMWKIENTYTPFEKDVLVLCPLSDGIERAIDLAIRQILEFKKIME